MSGGYLAPAQIGGGNYLAPAEPPEARHALAGSSCVQSNTSAVAQVVQRHQLAGSPSSQSNISGVGGIGEIRHALTGTPSSQANTSPGGAVVLRDPAFKRSAARTYMVPPENRVLKVQ